MLRPEDWTRPAGGSPVRVIAGEPGSRPRFVVERRRAERGVESLFGGSKRAGRSATRRESCSFGFRPKRSATDALERIRVAFPQGQQFVFESDIENFFGEIDHEILMSLVGERVSDRRVLKLLRQWLRAGVLVGGVVSETVTGTPQGGVTTCIVGRRSGP